MFESAELGHRVEKKIYKEEEPKLREALLNAQYDLKQDGRFSVLIIVAGPEGAGRTEMVNVLKEWMDPRHLVVKAFGPMSDEERERPPAWRFWRALPPKGHIGILFNAWYSLAFAHRLLGGGSAAEFDRHLEGTIHQEEMLANEGMLILKFWMHLSKKDFEARHKALARHPETRWRVTEEDQETYKRYGKLKKLAEHALRMTSTAQAPWIVVEGLDERYRNLTVGTVLLNALKERLEQKTPKPVTAESAPLVDVRQGVNLLDRLDLAKKLDRKDYDEEFAKWQGQLARLTRNPKFEKIAVVAAFEGNDAAGKGGAIRRVTSALDARALRRVSGRGADRRGARAALPVALLAPCSAQGPHRDLRSLLVWPRAGRAGRGVLLGHRLDAGLRGNQRFRGGGLSATASSWRSSGCRSARTSNTGASRSGRRPRSSASRSRPRTGATVRSGTSTRTRYATWWTAPAPSTRRGRWSRRTTSTTRGSRY